MKKFIMVSYMLSMSSFVLLAQNVSDINNTIESTEKTVEETKIQTLPGRLLLTSPDGKVAVTVQSQFKDMKTSGADTINTFNIWNTSTGELIESFEVRKDLANVQLLPDNNTLLVHDSKDTLLLRFNQ